VAYTGHEGVDGNEKADLLAKAGASMSLVGPEPYSGATKRKWESKISAWEAKSGITLQDRDKQNYSLSTQKREQVNSCYKKDLRTLVGLYTGHCPLKYYLHKLGQTDNAPVASAREQIKRRNTYYVLSPSKGYYT